MEREVDCKSIKDTIESCCTPPEIDNCEDYDAYVQARDDNWRRDLDSYIMRDPY